MEQKCSVQNKLFDSNDSTTIKLYKNLFPKDMQNNEKTCKTEK